MIFPLTERAGYAQILELAKVADLQTSEKFLEKLTLLAEAEDELALEARKVADTGGCANRLRNKGLEAFATFVIAAISVAPDHLLNSQINFLREFAESDREAVAEGMRRKEAAEQSAIERRIVAQAEQMGVGEILADIEQRGARLSLQGEQIVCSGGTLDLRQRIFVQTRRRDLILALQGRDHVEVV